MTLFQYSEKIIQHYPNLVGGVIVVDNLTCQPMPQTLRTAYVNEQEVVKARIGDQPLCIEAAIVTDKSMHRVFTEAALACLVGICFLWVALSVIGYAFR